MRSSRRPGSGSATFPSSIRWRCSRTHENGLMSAQRVALAMISALAIVSAVAATADPLEYEIVGDGIPAPLSPEGADPAHGRALVVAHESANCVLCHAVPDPAVRFAGDVGPSLAGVGQRLTVAQLRLRVVDELKV